VTFERIFLFFLTEKGAIYRDDIFFAFLLDRPLCGISPFESNGDQHRSTFSAHSFPLFLSAWLFNKSRKACSDYLEIYKIRRHNFEILQE